MNISTHLARIAGGTAAAGVLLLGGAGFAQAQEETPRPAPPISSPRIVAPQAAAPQAATPQTDAPQTVAPQSAAPQVLPAPSAPRQVTTAPLASPAPAPASVPQVRAVPEGAPETGGGPADPALGTVATLVGGGALALVVVAGVVTVAVRRRT